MNIRFEHVTKSYEDGLRPAVADLTLNAAEGEVTVLIGPSGCGKSTTMRMVNRLIEPDSGSIYLGEKNVAGLDLEGLRRSIGYAIQGVGLFPHWTVHENVGVVPWLLKWEQPLIDARVSELLDLVGLDPNVYGPKYPDELSGGEAQRVGVARALAADPPVLLMDEPFGAVDPITREKLQLEFAAIQKRLRKTVLLVTHDIDEAVRLADHIAIMRDGRLVQFDSPERILAYPNDDFVADFVGSQRAIKRLSLAPVTDALGPVPDAPFAASVRVGCSLRDALGKILETGERLVCVEDANGVVIGSVSIDDIVSRFARPLS